MKNAEFMPSNREFIIEFLAYSFTKLGVIKKVYVKALNNNLENENKKILLNDKKIDLISKAINNNDLKNFSLSRYVLYDISFRELNLKNNIGFSFIDTEDSNYIEPEKVFKRFKNFETESIINIVIKIQDSMFEQKPQYNPLSMIGVVFDNDILTCVKAYIRYDLSVVPTINKRVSIIRNIINTINSKITNADCFCELAKKFEKIGFAFFFVGVDKYIKGNMRYKLYFKFFGENDMCVLSEKIVSILKQFDFCDSFEGILNNHTNMIWGIALSTDSFEYVNGIQLYLYP